MPADSTAAANAAFSARKPNPGWSASAWVAVAARTTAVASSRSSAFGPSVSGTTALMASRSHDRVIRRAISPRFAMKTVPKGVAAVPGVLNASIATRHRPPTRRAGSLPVAIHRWTDRRLAPSRSAASRGVTSRVIAGAIVALRPRSRPAGFAALFRFPCRRPLFGERAEAFLRLVARSLPGDDPRRVPLGRSVAQPAYLADDRLRR